MGAGCTFMEALDPLQARKCHDKSLPVVVLERKLLPNGVLEEMRKEVAKQYDQEIQLQTRGLKELSAEWVKLGGGDFLKHLREKIQQVVEGKDPGDRLEVYSGHDLTLTALLANLGARVMRWPPYASNIVIELWRKDLSGPQSDSLLAHSQPLHASEFGQYAVRIFYNGIPLVISPSIDSLSPTDPPSDDPKDWYSFAEGCPVEKFLDYTKSRIVSNLAQECERKEEEKKEEEEQEQEIPKSYGLQPDVLAKPPTHAYPVPVVAMNVPPPSGNIESTTVGKRPAAGSLKNEKKFPRFQDSPGSKPDDGKPDDGGKPYTSYSSEEDGGSELSQSVGSLSLSGSRGLGGSQDNH